MDKLLFVAGVVNLVLTIWLLASMPHLLPWFYTLKFPVLIGLRIVMYKMQNYQWFCADFCYFGNLAVLFFLWFAPHDERFMMFAYGITHGPLSWAVPLFRNALVFHDYDKLTSVFIHITPTLVMYCIRWGFVSPLFVGWRPEDRWYHCAAQWPGSMHGGVSSCKGVDYTWTFRLQWLVIAPFMYFCAWFMLYGVMVAKWLPKDKVSSQPSTAPIL